MKDHIAECLKEALQTLLRQGALPAETTVAEVRVERSRQPSLGDYSSNLALRLARGSGCSAPELAQQLLEAMPPSPHLRDGSVAGPGFLNFFVRTETRLAVIGEVLTAGEAYGRAEDSSGESIQVEFVSANPTGPLHVGHGRGAAYGDCVARLLEAAGHRVQREYYVNDAGRQMDILSLSLWLRYIQHCGDELPLPDGAYQGEYLSIHARSLLEAHGEHFRHHAATIGKVLAAKPADDSADQHLDSLIAELKRALGEEDYRLLANFGRDRILDDIRDELKDFGIEFDRWFAESSLAGEPTEQAIARLQAGGHTEQRDGALWFLSSRFGDRQDRVLRRSNGQLTYFASDVAYHFDKFQRGFDRVIDIWGADHHGYIERVRASIAALDLPPERLEVKLVQLVRLMRGSEPVQMSTRSGEFVTLRALRDEVGKDAARFFYIMRRVDQDTDFDLELALAQNRDNPVYHLQYAHARTSGVLRQLEENGLRWERDQGLAALEQLSGEQTEALAMRLGQYPDTVHSAAAERAPHLLANYLRELAAAFHPWYDQHRILVEDTALRDARLCLVMAVRQVLRNGLGLLGLSAPDRM